MLGQIQLKEDLGAVQPAVSNVNFITDRLKPRFGNSDEMKSLSIITDQEKKVRTVVITLSSQDAQPVVLAELVCLQESFQRLVESIEKHQNDGTVDQYSGSRFTIAGVLQCDRCAIVMKQGFFKSIQLVIEVSNIDVQPGGSDLEIRLLKDLARLFRQRQRFTVLSQRHQSPYQRRSCPCSFDLFVALLEKRERRPIALYCFRHASPNM